MQAAEEKILTISADFDDDEPIEEEELGGEEIGEEEGEVEGWEEGEGEEEYPEEEDW